MLDNDPYRAKESGLHYVLLNFIDVTKEYFSSYSPYDKSKIMCGNESTRDMACEDELTP